MDLPTIAISMIPNDIATVLDGSVSERKRWFILVRKTREVAYGYGMVQLNWKTYNTR